MFVTELCVLWEGSVDGSEGFLIKTSKPSPGSAPHERLTYGMKGTEVAGGPSFEGERFSGESGPPGFSTYGRACFCRA